MRQLGTHPDLTRGAFNRTEVDNLRAALALGDEARRARA